MNLLVGLTIVGAGALHAVWNSLAKQLNDRLLTLALIGIPMTVAGVAAVLTVGLPPGPVIWLAVASAAVHVVYGLALMNSYRLGALNHVYPIARGISPLAVTVGAFLFVHERLAAAPSAGVAILALGLISLAFSAGSPTSDQLPAIGAAIITGLTIASYSLIDGLGVRHAHDVFAYAALLFLLLGPVFPLVAIIQRRARLWQAAPVSAGVTAGVLFVVAYSVVLWAQTRAPLAVVASLRETSVIFAALIGTVFLNEGFGARRIVAAIAVVVGVSLIAA
jgi:drug/metabolite transporter (DMT)-like permease